MESGISIKLTESRIQVPLAKTGIQYLEYGIRRRVQNPRLSRTVADPDLQIGGGGGGGVHPDPEIGGGARPPKTFFFRPFGPHFGRKIRGGRAPGPLSWIRHRWIPLHGAIYWKIPKDITNECIHYLAPDFHPSLSH